MKKKHQKDGKTGDRLRRVRTRALDTERLAEVARKVVRIAKARYKEARKALKAARKTVKLARKDAKAAAKEWRNFSDKAAKQAPAKSRKAKTAIPRAAKPRRASSRHIARNRDLNPAPVVPQAPSGVPPAVPPTQ